MSNRKFNQLAQSLETLAGEPIKDLSLSAMKYCRGCRRVYLPINSNQWRCGCCRSTEENYLKVLLTNMKRCVDCTSLFRPPGPTAIRCGGCKSTMPPTPQAVKIPRFPYPEDNGCEICGVEWPNRLLYEHCHVSALHRGWVCGSCNVGLSGIDRFLTDPHWRDRVKRYLHRARRVSVA